MNYKFLIVVPVILIVLTLLYLFWVINTSELKLDIDLKGGNQIIAESATPIDEKKIEAILIPYDASVRMSRGLTTYSIFINFDASIDPQNVLDTLKDSGYDFKEYSTQTVGTTLGSAFFTQALTALTFSFIFMAIVAFVIFRKPVLSLRVIFSAFADIVETFAVSQLIGIKLSLATFAALLLIIGYSADDDIMLTTKVIKGTGEIKERIKRARKTAFTMIGTTMVALLSLFIINESIIIDQIASIMLIGLVFDLVNTWLFNAPLLRWYVEKRIK